MGLLKSIKKIRKKLHLPAITLGNAAKVGAIAATGGVGALGASVVASKLKSAAVGGIKQVIRSKAAKALGKRVVAQTPEPRPTTAAATTMPGGAPLGAKARGRPRARKAKAPKSPPKPRSGAKRAPPKGGKDLKALAASWKAAGKPGKWLDWVKTH